jgi:hypothetical protein
MQTGSNRSCMAKFPANREINREFCRFRPSAGDFRAKSASELSGLQQNSLCNGIGNVWTHNREFFVKSREFSRGPAGQRPNFLTTGNCSARACSPARRVSLLTVWPCCCSRRRNIADTLSTGRRAGSPPRVAAVRPDLPGRRSAGLLCCAAEGLSAQRFAEYLSLGQSPDALPRARRRRARRVASVVAGICGDGMPVDICV